MRHLALRPVLTPPEPSRIPPAGFGSLTVTVTVTLTYTQQPLVSPGYDEAPNPNPNHPQASADAVQDIGKSYARAGGIANESISEVRTVAALGAQEVHAQDFHMALDEASQASNPNPNPLLAPRI